MLDVKVNIGLRQRRIIRTCNAKGGSACQLENTLHFLKVLTNEASLLKKYQVAFTETTMENKKLKQENAQLEQSLEKATQESTLK